MTGRIEPFVHQQGFGAQSPTSSSKPWARRSAAGSCASPLPDWSPTALDIRTVVAVAFVAAVRGSLVGCRFGRAVVLAQGARFAITPGSARPDREYPRTSRLGRGDGRAVLSPVTPTHRARRGHNPDALAALPARQCRWRRALVGGLGLDWRQVDANARVLPALLHLLHRAAWAITPPLLVAVVAGDVWHRRRGGCRSMPARGNWTAWGACAREGAMNEKPAPAPRNRPNPVVTTG